MSKYTAVGRHKNTKVRPVEFWKDVDAGMSQTKMREKYAAGDETINRWKDEVYIERAEKIRKRR